MARLNVMSVPATGFDVTINGSAQKTPYWADYPEGTTVTITWPETQVISTRGLFLTTDIEYSFDRVQYDTNIVSTPSITVTVTDTTSVTGIYRRAASKVSGPLGIWWFPILSRVLGAAPFRAGT